MGQHRESGSESVRRQAPRRKAGGSEPLPSVDHMPEDMLKVGVEDSADTPRTDAPRTDAPRTDAPRTDAPRTDAPRTDAPRANPLRGTAVETADRPREHSGTSKQPGEVNAKVLVSSLFAAPLVIMGILGLVFSLFDGIEASEAVAAETTATTTASTTASKTIEPIDWDHVEKQAKFYCRRAFSEKYEEDWDTVRDVCTALVMDEIRSDEERFRDPYWTDNYGVIFTDTIESVLGDPEEFLEDYGYTTTTSSSSSRTTTSTYDEPEPTYEEPEPTYEAPEPVYEEPATNSGSGSGASAGTGGGGVPLEWRAMGPFGGLQGCEEHASHQPLGASECYVGSDNLYYYDARVQAFR